jgi:hypothetical protein
MEAQQQPQAAGAVRVNMDHVIDGIAYLDLIALFGTAGKIRRLCGSMKIYTQICLLRLDSRSYDSPQNRRLSGIFSDERDLAAERREILLVHDREIRFKISHFG